MDNIKIEYLPIKDLKPYERNQRKHADYDVSQIMVSIQKYGFNDPIGIWSDKNIIVEGHGRLAAAKKLKMKEVPVIRLDHLTDEQRKEYAIIHNKTAELSEWDFDLLAEDIPALDFSDFDIDWGLPDLDDDIEIVEDEVPEPPAEPKSKIGDLYQLGEHRIICGDSTDVNVIGRLMDGQMADIAFTSPPYNVGDSASLNGNTHMTECKYQSGNDDRSDYDELLAKTTDNMLIFSKWSFINLQMLANNKHVICEWLNNYKDDLCDIAIWYKNTTAPAMAKKVMNSQFEFIFIFSKENNSRAIGTKEFRGTVSNVYAGSAQRKNEYAEIHSATFPVEFASHFIKNFTNECNSVLDVFGGTGTTLIACEQLNRKCYMCELDPRYVDVIIERWEKFTGKKAVLL